MLPLFLTAFLFWAPVPRIHASGAVNRFVRARLPLLSPFFFGNACSSTGSGGNWNVAGTWTNCGGTYPTAAAGDTATITASAPVTCPTGVTCTAGDGVTSTDAVTVNATAELIVNGTLHLDGNLNHRSSTITGGADGAIEFGNAGYTWKSDTDFGGTANNNNMFRTSGTSAAHPFSVSTVTGGTQAVTTANGRGSNKAVLSYVNFTRMGNSGSGNSYIFKYGGTTSIYLHNVQIDHFSCDQCGRLDISAAPAGAGWVLANLSFTNTASTNNLFLNGVPNPTAPRTLDASYFDKQPSIQGNSAVYTRNVFVDGFTRTSGAADWARFGEASYNDGDANFVRITFTTGLLVAGGFTGNYFLTDSPNAVATSGTAASGTNLTNTATLAVSGTPWTNNQYQADSSSSAWMVELTSGTGAGQIRSIQSNTNNTLTVLYPWATIPDGTTQYSILKGLGNPKGPSMAGTNAATVYVTYNVAEHTGADNNGDFVSSISSTSSSYVINYNLLIPSGSRDNPYCLASPANNASPFSAEHNTVWVGGQPVFMLSDGTDVPAGKMGSYKSNLAVADPAMMNKYAISGSPWQASPHAPYHLTDSKNASNVANGTQNIVAPGNVTYNGQWGLKTGYGNNLGYNINESAAIDSTGGVNANPQFLDDTRNIGKWAYVRGYSVSVNPLTRVSDALVALKADPTRTADLIRYVRQGFIPLNPSTGHDGATIGAIPAPSLFPLPTSMIR